MQQTWNLTIQAKAKKSFRFKFKSTQFVPTWKLHRLSLIIKLRQFILKAKLNSQTTESRYRNATMKSKIIRIFNKIGIPRIKNRYRSVHYTKVQSPLHFYEESLLVLKHHVYKEPIFVATLCIGVLIGFLAQSIFSVVQKCFGVYSLAALVFLCSMLSGKYNNGRILKLLVIVMVAVSASSTVFSFRNYTRCWGRYVTDYIEKGSKFAALVFMNQ